MTTTGIEAPGISFQYADLNIRHTGDPNVTLNLVKRAVRMGYDAVAINIDVGDIVPSEFLEDGGYVHQDEDEQAGTPAPPSKKRKKDQKKLREQTIPEPFLIDESLLDLSSLANNGRKFRMYSRLTFTLNDASVIHNVFHNPQLKKYDIIAVRPGDESILNTLTRKTDNVDIICFDSLAPKVSWAMKGKSMEMIRAEGVGFEVSYGPALADKEARRTVLSNGRIVIRALKFKGIVFTSAANEICDLRAPVDAMNMLYLWGVDAEKARTMISGYPRQVLLRAEARRTVRGSLHVARIKSDEGSKVDIPTKTKSKSEALRKLLTIPFFNAQVEVVQREEDGST